jgi:hypothetical protein
MVLKSARTNKSAARKSTRPKSTMSAAHKKALAAGRDESRAVRRYLQALEANRPKRGRRRTPDSIKSRLKEIDNRLSTADALSRVLLTQEKINLGNELNTREAKVDMAALEAGFVAAARGYGERKGLSYAAWRAAGVDPTILRKAGVARTRTVRKAAPARKR